MSSSFNLDSKSVLIDKLGEDSKRFAISNLYFKNTKGLNAIYEIRKLEAELLDFAKDPTMGENQMKHLKPLQPTPEGRTDEEYSQAIEDYRKLMKEYEIAQTATKMQVPIPDMFAIQQYMQPFEDTINATPAVKGRRFHAFTKDVAEPNQGLFGMGKKQPQ